MCARLGRRGFLRTLGALAAAAGRASLGGVLGRSAVAGALASGTSAASAAGAGHSVFRGGLVAGAGEGGRLAAGAGGLLSCKPLRWCVSEELLRREVWGMVIPCLVGQKWVK